MIQIEVGLTAERQSYDDLVADAEYIKRLWEDRRFVRMMTNAAERLVNKWSHAPTTEKREAAWYTLQGLNELLGEMSRELDQGVVAAAALQEFSPGKAPAGSTSSEETRGVTKAAQSQEPSVAEQFAARQKHYDAAARGATDSDQPSTAP